MKTIIKSLHGPLYQVIGKLKLKIKYIIGNKDKDTEDLYLI